MQAKDIRPFVKAVESEISEHPYERAPFVFAALPMDAWAKRLECSEKTVERKFDDPPFHSERVRIDGAQMRIVRVRAPGEPIRYSFATIANLLQKPWLERWIDVDSLAMAAASGKPWDTRGAIKDGKATMTRRQHWFLVRLAAAWPNGHQIAILKCVLKDWSGFASRAESALALAQDLKTGDPNLPIKGKRFHKFPTLSTMLWFSGAAIEHYEDFLQETIAEKATWTMGKFYAPHPNWDS